MITSNYAQAAAFGAHIPVGVFTDAQALPFLAQRTGLDDQAVAAEVASAVGFLPLALAQAAAVIAEQALDYPGFLARLGEMPVQDYLAHATGEPYPDGVGEVIALALDTAADADRTGLARGIISLMALLSAEGVPRSFLHAAGQRGLLGQSGDGAAAGPATVDEALGKLAGASLLTFSNDRSAVAEHPLTLRVALERAAVPGDGTMAGAARGAVSLLSEDTMSTRSDLAHAYEENDDPQKAVPVRELLLDDAIRVFGPGHENAIVCQNNLARAYELAGRLGDATLLYEQSLAGFEQLLGTDHPYSVQGRHNMAGAYRVTDRLPEAIALYERVIFERERILGDSHPETLRSRNNLGLALTASGELAEAIALLERTVADRKRVLGDSHPDTLKSRNDLALAYQAAGQPADGG